MAALQINNCYKHIAMRSAENSFNIFLGFSTGAARLTQIFLPLIRRANGRIIFVSSGNKFINNIDNMQFFSLISNLFLSFPALARVPAPVRGALQNFQK